MHSKWVRAEAHLADDQNKLITVCDEALKFKDIPLPFNTRQTEVVTKREKIFAALVDMQVAPGLVPKVRVMVGAWQTTSEMWLKPGESFRDLDIAPEMVVIPPGEFLMGSKKLLPRERPRHKVSIPRAFAVGKYPVTFAEWDAAVAVGGMSYTPPFGEPAQVDDRGWGRGRRPVNGVSWDDAQSYVKWLSKKTGQPYRLLSEAEWEYACRAGTTTAYYFGADITKKQAQFSKKTTVDVGSFPPNAFGLCDMHGNVWEWCEDCWNDSYEGAPSDGSAWTTGVCVLRILRGGCWCMHPVNARSDCRFRDYSRNPFYGFRVARTIDSFTIRSLRDADTVELI